MPLKYQWRLPRRTTSSGKIKRLASITRLPRFVIRLLSKRGLNNAKAIHRFLCPAPDQLGNPFRLHDMRRAVTLIRSAIHTHQRITVYGDYDVDGITSTSIMALLLKHFGADVHYFIPNRFRDGYGPNLKEYRKIIAAGTKLLITVDNGISGQREVKYAREHGTDVIIADHHDFPPADQLPPANAIVMAKYPGHQYHPDAHGHSVEDFCGAGIALKIAQAMLGVMNDNFWALAALGTVADSVNLVHENRVIVAYGLKKIQSGANPGIRALAQVAKFDLARLKSTDLSFTIIPRLNALGRMGDANVGVKLLITPKASTAANVAVLTEQRNRERQRVMSQQTQAALKQAATASNRHKCTLVLADRHWFPGVVGIIASRVINRYYKPTIVIGHLKFDDQRGIDRGSGRSIPGFNLFRALTPLRETMTSFGGHPMACGLSIKPHAISKLRDGLERAGRHAHLERVRPQIAPDLWVTPKMLTRTNLHWLDQLGPFGVGNPRPLLAVRLPQVTNVRQMGKQRNHLSFRTGLSYHATRAVAFGMGRDFNSLVRNPHRVLAVGYLEINHYHGHDYPQFLVKHLARYRSGVPERRAFVKVYVLVRSSPRPLSSNQIAQASRLNRSRVDLILKVFLELQFFKTVRGHDAVYYTAVPHPRPRSLTASRTYQRYATPQVIPHLN